MTSERRVKMLKKIKLFLIALCLVLLSGCGNENEPVATSTPAPTAEPTATTAPTATPEPTATPVPTATTAPTATPEPTAPPAPTATPEPAFSVKEVDISAYSMYAASFGGIIPVSKDDKWGVIDYTGKEIIPCEYDDIQLPNDRGYIVMALFNDNGRENILFDKNGNRILTTTDKIVASSDAYVITTEEPAGPGIVTFYKYYDYDGKLLAEIPTEYPDESFTSDRPHGFYDGKSAVMGQYRGRFYDKEQIFDYVTMYDFGFVDILGKTDWVVGGLGEPGDAYLDETEAWAVQEQFLSEHSEIADPFVLGLKQEVQYPVNSPVEGFFLTVPRDFDLEGYYLRSVDGSNVCYFCPWDMKIVDDTLKYSRLMVDDSGRMIPTFVGPLEESDTPPDDFGLYSSASLTGFPYDGDYFYNYGTKVVLVSNRKYALINLDAELEYKIFDYFVTGAGKNCLCQIGEDRFYCDHDGNIVSQAYEEASPFTSKGYALVNEGQETWLINENFEKLVKVGSFTGLSANGDLLTISDGDTTRIFVTEE